MSRDGNGTDGRDYVPSSATRYGGRGARDGASPGGDPADSLATVSLRGRASPFEFRRALRLDRAGKRKVRFRRRSGLILVAASPLLLAAFGSLVVGDAIGMGVSLGLFALYAFATYLIREGNKAEEAYLDRTFASPPALPRKLLGSLALGGATILTGLYGWGIDAIQSVGMGVLAAGASLLTFGLDPMRAKGEIALSGVTPKMVEEAVAEAEERIEGIERAAADIADRPLRERLARITARSRDILARIEKDPSDLRRARKFLKVYLDGALEATRKYARSQHDLADSDMYLKFRSLLDDMEATFDQQHEKLLTNDRIDLDVEIDVLAERLNRETVLQ